MNGPWAIVISVLERELRSKKKTAMHEPHAVSSGSVETHFMRQVPWFTL